MEHGNALVIPACEYRRTRWHNGRGWTREILCVPTGSSVPAGPDAAVAGDQAWDLRLSIAEVEAAAAYSSFPGIEREQVLLVAMHGGFLCRRGIPAPWAMPWLSVRVAPGCGGCVGIATIRAPAARPWARVAPDSRSEL